VPEAAIKPVPHPALALSEGEGAVSIPSHQEGERDSVRGGRITLVAIAVVIAISPIAFAEDKPGDLVEVRQLSLDLANEIAWNALKACRRENAQIAVAVVDRGGRTQVLLRDALAGPHTIQASQGKAVTALSFRIPTSQLAAETGPGSPASGLRSVDGVTAVGGGLVIQSRGSIVGAIGVSGAQGPANDEACARAGIESVVDRLALPD
jgi:uncharacterized protein GlcG (DUF336 family)